MAGSKRKRVGLSINLSQDQIVDLQAKEGLMAMLIDQNLKNQYSGMGRDTNTVMLVGLVHKYNYTYSRGFDPITIIGEFFLRLNNADGVLKKWLKK